MIIAEIPKDVNDPEYSPSEPSVKPYTPEEMQGLKVWTFQLKNPHQLQASYESTDGNLTCKFEVDFSSKHDDDEIEYEFTVFSGIRSYAGIKNAGEIHCAIILSADSKEYNEKGSTVEFDRIHIEAVINDDPKGFLVMPTSLDSSILPLSTNKYIFEQDIDGDEQKYSMKSTQKLSNLITFGIYGRNFNLDSDALEANMVQRLSVDPSENEIEPNEIEVEDESTEIDLSVKMTIYVFLMIVLSVVTTIMVRRKLQTPYVKPDLRQARKSFAY